MHFISNFAVQNEAGGGKNKPEVTVIFILSLEKLDSEFVNQTRPQKMALQLSEAAEGGSESEAEDQQGWGQWAWSFVPQILEDDEPVIDEVQERRKPQPSVFSLGTYAYKMSITFKVCMCKNQPRYLDREFKQQSRRGFGPNFGFPYYYLHLNTSLYTDNKFRESFSSKLSPRQSPGICFLVKTKCKN